MISVLATVDGSPESLAVIPTLEKLASDLKARVQLLTVVERPRGTVRRPVALPQSTVAGGYPGGTPIVQEPEQPQWAETGEQAMARAMAEGRDFLRAAAQRLEARGFDVQADLVVDGNVSKAISNCARRYKFDLIAMATHGRGGLSDLVQGSVASAVVRAGVAPVLLTRPSKSQVRTYRASIARASRGGALRLPAT
jgi:nucleotide-binding universal stress UspA family protein